jgi:hypothetical protein
LRELAGRVFTDHGSVCRDAGQQIRMSPGIGVIHAAGQHRDGRATGHQSPLVRGGVDAVGGTGDDGPSLAGEAYSDLAGDMSPVGGCGTAAHHRHRTLPAGTQLAGAANPQRIRPDRTEVVDGYDGAIWDLALVS